MIAALFVESGGCYFGLAAGGFLYVMVELVARRRAAAFGPTP